MYTLDLHVKKTMFKNRFEILLRKIFKKVNSKIRTHRDYLRKERWISKIELRESRKTSSFIDNSLMSKIIKVCKVRSIETNKEVEVKMANIVKIDVVKAKFRTQKQKSLKIVISLIFQR